jgi:hypothetical protein
MSAGPALATATPTIANADHMSRILVRISWSSATA